MGMKRQYNILAVSLPGTGQVSPGRSPSSLANPVALRTADSLEDSSALSQAGLRRSPAEPRVALRAVLYALFLLQDSDVPH
jgi:hypothetical protein